jgi:hypothetical protein
MIDASLMREIADKTSDTLLVALLFGLQTVLATGYAGQWF